MKLVINGEDREFETTDDSALLSVIELLGHLELAGIPVVVEHNKEALLPKEHKTTMLSDGDQLEIIRVVAGG